MREKETSSNLLRPSNSVRRRPQSSPYIQRNYAMEYIIKGIVSNYIAPLESVHGSIHSVRYDMVRSCCLRSSQIGPHQVTYEAVARLIRIFRA
eukprot:scaffold2801_cov178-Skeletonema_marinoi.AAC.1